MNIGEIDTHIHKRITFDVSVCGIYHIPVGNCMAIIAPTDLNDWKIYILDLENKEILVECFFASLEECLDELDRRYGGIDAKA